MVMGRELGGGLTPEDDTPKLPCAPKDLVLGSNIAGTLSLVRTGASH